MVSQKTSKNWHTEATSDIVNALNSHELGLTKKEAAKRLQKFGPNKLPEGKMDDPIIIFLRQFSSPLIYVLLAAAGIVFLMGELIDSLIILAVLLFNAIVGTIQEGKAQNALLALKKFVETSATVLRDGKELVILDTEVVPGDIIILQEGEKIPADARVVFANNLKVDEASFTGESQPVTKFDKVILPPKTPVADQRNMVFKGTNVLSGNGTAIVVATGLLTEIGKIARKITAIDTDIPLKANIRYLSRLIIIVVGIISAALIIFGLFSSQSLQEMFTTAVALSVSVIPEGLPIVITLVLATGVRRMSNRDVLVKRLQAVEALGQTKIIAVDKTGTITKNEMIIQRVYVDDKDFEISGNGYEPKGEASLNSENIDILNHPELVFSGKIAALGANARLSFLEDTHTWKIAGDPTEAAILVFSEKIGFHRDTLDKETPKIFELPFDYKRKYRAIIREVDKKNFLTIIGAPEKILGSCDYIWSESGIKHLDENERRNLEAKFNKMASDGFRVVAYAFNDDTEQSVSSDNLPPLTFVGFFGMSDTLRPGVKEAVQKVKSAGMKVIMITGDHRFTAQAVAEEAGIWHEGDHIIIGDEIDKMSEVELTEKLGHTGVFARVTPDHKLRIIEAYHKRGEIVAMTGDGVNDAPSLVAADLGVAMGKVGTEVAKEASDVVLLDDNFASIVSAAEEGRRIYKTIKRVILYLFSTNTGELFVIVGALLMGLPLPLIAAQIIWLNFITDGFLDMALAMEPKEKGLMKGKFKRPPKWIVDGFMAQRIILMALPMTIGTIYLFMGYFEFNLIKAWTISLTTLAVFQWFNAWNCRSEEKSIFQMNPFSNMYLVGATALVILLQIAALHTSFLQKILRTTPLSLSEWTTIIVISLSIIAVEEIRKIFYRRKLRKA